MEVTDLERCIWIELILTLHLLNFHLCGQRTFIIFPFQGQILKRLCQLSLYFYAS